MRSAPRPSILLGAALLALCLASCGGGGDSTATGGSTATSGSSSTATTGGAPTAGGQTGSKGSGDSTGEGPQSAGGGGGGHSGDHEATSPPAKAAPLRVSGGGSAQFRSKGGDNSVQEFGEESDESELQEAAEAVHEFYVARVGEEWARACSYLSAGEQQQLEQIAAQSPQFKGKGCAAILDAFTRPLPPALQREITTVDAGSLRREGEQAFLIYFGAPERTVYSMPMVEEGGAWKVTALSASALP